MASINQSPPALEASKDKDLREEDVKTIYEEVCKAYHSIDDFRSKLLGLLPLVSGTGIFFLLKDGFTDPKKIALSPSSLVSIGLFGFIVTLGLFFYELHGILRCIWLIELGKRIEGLMGIV